MENLSIDENSRNVLGAITNDVSELIKNVRVNPSTGRLLVDAHVTSTNTSIGDTIPGGTAGSILFLGAGSTLAQDNANLFYDDTNNFVGFGTNTPSATLDIEGTLKYADGSESNGFILESDASGNATWIDPTTIPGLGGITSINSDTTVAQILSDAVGGLINIVDAGSGTHTFAIDILGLANSTTFISDLTSNTTFKNDIINIVNGGGGSVQINLATQVTGILPIANGGTNSGTALSGSSIMISDGTHIVQGAKGTITTLLHGNAAGAPTYSAVDLTTDVIGLLPASNIDITNLESTLDLANIAGQIDLTTQVSGILPLANGGTQTALTDPGFDAIYIWDETDGATSLSTIGSGLNYDHSTHTLSASGGTVNFATTVEAYDDFTNAFYDNAITAVTIWSSYPWKLVSNSGVVNFGFDLGQVQLGTTTSATTYLQTQQSFVDDITTYDWSIGTRISGQLTSTGTFVGFGFGDANGTAFPTPNSHKNIGIVADHTSQTWQGFSSDGAATTFVGAAAFTDNTLTDLQVIFTQSTQTAEFFVDGVSIGTINTNIPASQSGTFFMGGYSNAGNLQIDYAQYSINNLSR